MTPGAEAVSPCLSEPYAEKKKIESADRNSVQELKLPTGVIYGTKVLAEIGESEIDCAEQATMC